MSQRRSNIEVPTWIVAAIIFLIVGIPIGYYAGSLQYKVANDVWAIGYGKLEKDYGKLDDKYEELEKENSALIVENKLLQEKDELRLQKIDLLEKELAEKENELVAKENELTETKKERDAYKQRLDWVEKEKVDEVNKLNEVIKGMKQEIEALRQKIKELEEPCLPVDIRITYPTENKVFKFYSWQWQEFKIDNVRGTFDGTPRHKRFWLVVNPDDGNGGWTERYDPQCRVVFDEDDKTWKCASPVYITGATSIKRQCFRILLVEVTSRVDARYEDYLEEADYYGLRLFSGTVIWDEVVVIRQIR